MNMVFRHTLPLLELDVLKTFVAIAETGNFTNAAERVHRTPSAVSMQIKKLEEMLNGPLFLRDARSVSLTTRGEVLLGYARRLLALNNEAVARFLLPDLNGSVRLGVVDDISEWVLPNVLKAFAQCYPNIMVDVRIANSATLRKMVDEHRIDIAIYNCGCDGAEDGEILLRETLVWAGARCGSAHLRAPLPVSMWDEGCSWRSSAVSALEKSGRDYRIALLSAYTSGQKAALRADLAVAPLPRYLVSGDLVALGEADGLPPLGDNLIGMRVIDGATPPVTALAGHVRDAFHAIAAGDRVSEAA
ncbi:LysR family transcriptional regulator [Xaviernesmea oryzae]|uniref:HTH-type transcriptional regulator TtuA n=1 Tax=Xaviernesmea oryzae TaxID=464029 RepID=A0A1Q9B0J9_9HYPH|nr:LysR family transcriptional regulator [Xaviernesmea oryzae]OLP61512.1 LysR family transcriptional regulator [Xaviernesmea oryzae]SEL66868.1 DNA-binding transcriptional regulator, LysR family [Xaviernesmea oryzae]